MDDKDYVSVICRFCRHLHTPSLGVMTGRATPTCEAFPGGIPDEITHGDETHDGPVEGDGGIHFEPIDS